MIDAIGVALVAGPSGVAAGQGKVAVIERGPGPAVDRVACIALVGEPRLHVVRIGRALEIRLMTGIASRRGPMIDAGAVALVTGPSGVAPGQGEKRMVEVRWPPGADRVACIALVREARLRVVRVGRALIVRLMARIAKRRGPMIDAVTVALVTGPSGVAPGQGEKRVVEVRRPPGADRVAGGALVREARLDVVRVGRCLVIPLMAGIAERRRPMVDAIPMALVARATGVPAGQGEERVIEVRRFPTVDRVACAALVREARLRVVRIGRSLVVRLVA